jgi:23S rRNA pseudouridine955/2504/2580 synthase
MTGVETVTVADSDDTIRLDRWFRRHYPALAHARLEKLLRTGQVRIDGRRAQAGDRLAAGQAIRVPPLPPAPQRAAAPRPSARDASLLERAILHRDDWLIALNKPAGLAVQGGTKAERHLDGMLDALRFGHDERPRLVHRLDKETSGVLLIARSASVAATLTRAFREKTTRKLYWAVVAGLPRPPAGTIDLALAKRAGPGGERVRAGGEDARSAVTHYRTVETIGERASWLALMPLTGRTHQLRAHCAAIGTPIIGDDKYGGGPHSPASLLPDGAAASGLYLHARSLTIPHPHGGTLTLTAPLPPHMAQLWQFLGLATKIDDPFAAETLPG